MNDVEWFDGVEKQLKKNRKASASGRSGSGYYIRLTTSDAEFNFWLNPKSEKPFGCNISGEIPCRYQGFEDFQLSGPDLTRDELILLVRIFCGITLH